jgi:CII-binding regulator of phage lambda lysogenization HflD
VNDRNALASALERFIQAHGDEARLALGLETLEQALKQARNQGLVGWASEIQEYVWALLHREELNRPL